MERGIIRLNGIVQGVGFRPFIYRLARSFGLLGKVYNSSHGVVVEVEGPREVIASFYEAIPQEQPPLAVIIESSLEWGEPLGYTDFSIDTSKGEKMATVLVAPDVGICQDCTRELLNPSDRRFGYPFINCTNCGPRFTIVRNLPYDRPFTTMAPFPMCPQCQEEYDDPADRRFHAQPNACRDCGPAIWLDGGAEPPADFAPSEQVLAAARAKIQAGQILAVKGLGGFHLICDATNETAVATLRQRKKRPFKPFAVMCRDLETARKYCHISATEEEILTSWRKPIVLMAKSEGSELAPSVAPRLDKLGVMLAYTPLHLLLFQDGLECLVATSANFSDYPLVTDNLVAWEKLQSIVDSYLFHNREIFNRCDDSVVKAGQHGLIPLRRARGFAPQPLLFPQSSGHTLAFGGDEKNTFCLTRDERYFVSQHIGELNNLESLDYLDKAIARFQHYFEAQPELVVHDLHPEYRSTKKAKLWAQEAGLPTVPVQHHKAHLAACLLEHGHTESVLGVICDGTGYGEDGRLWGFEIFGGSLPQFERLAHLGYTPLPGGEAAIREPWRMAYSHLHTHLGNEAADGYGKRLGYPEKTLALLSKQIELGLNAPLTSSAGRLFDAVSAFLGIGVQGTYEGQPAIELEVAAKGSPLAGMWNERLDFDVSVNGGECLIDPTAMWRDLARRQAAGEDPAELGARFHHTVAEMILQALRKIDVKQGSVNAVALSGGVFQNDYLTELLRTRLENLGYKVLLPRSLPVNDGGISAGQALLGHMVSIGGR